MNELGLSHRHRVSRGTLLVLLIRRLARRVAVCTETAGRLMCIPRARATAVNVPVRGFALSATIYFPIRTTRSVDVLQMSNNHQRHKAYACERHNDAVSNRFFRTDSAETRISALSVFACNTVELLNVSDPQNFRPSSVRGR